MVGEIDNYRHDVYFPENAHQSAILHYKGIPTQALCEGLGSLSSVLEAKRTKGLTQVHAREA